MRALLVLGLVACGAAPAVVPPPAAPPSAPAPVPSEPAPTTAACHGSFAKKKPAGWVEVGTLLVKVKDEMPVGYELRDGTGKKVDEGDINVKSARAAGEAVAQKICRIDGVLAVYEEKAGAGGTMTVSVVKPAREDEAGDVAAMCKPLSDDIMKIKPDPSQQVRIALDVYTESLTSKKWRAWLHDGAEKVRKASEGERVAARRSLGADLEAAAKTAGLKDCWFASSLKK